MAEDAEQQTEQPAQTALRPKPKNKLRLKLALLVGLCLVLVALVAFGVDEIYNFFSKPATKTDKTAQTPQKVVATGYNSEQLKAFDTYSKLINDGKYDEAEAYVKTMPITDANKASFLADIANLKTKQLALSTYLAKEKDGTWTYDDAWQIARIYKQEGNIAQAKAYYEKAKDLLKQSGSPTAGDTLKMLDAEESSV